MAGLPAVAFSVGRRLENTSIGIMSNQRLLSLDFMRGFIMVLLTLESTRLYDHLSVGN